MTESHFQLALLPHLGLNQRSEIRVGRAVAWNFDSEASARIPDEAMRDRITRLLNMYTAGENFRTATPRIRGIGVVSIATTDFRVFNRSEHQAASELRSCLFLGCLSSNVRLGIGPNVGHSLYTSENFTIVYQNFTIDSEYTAEETGVIVRLTIGGYKIDETRFSKPSYVNQPN